MKTEPVEDQIPPSLEDFSIDFQVCFDILEGLDDTWCGSTGLYLGKDFTNINYIFELYNVHKSLHLEYLLILKYINNISKDQINGKILAKAKGSKHGRKNN